MGNGKKRAYVETLAAQAVHSKLEENNAAYNGGLFKWLRFLVHLIAALQFSYGAYYHYFKVHLPINDAQILSQDDLINAETRQWGGKFKFLTFLNVIFQAFYHTLALLNDLFGSNDVHPLENKPALRKVRDYLFATIAFPVALNVCVSFWVIYFIDRELIFPASLDEIFPNWLNHIVHTNIAMLIILDMFTCFRQYPQRKSGLLGTMAFMHFYVIWIHIVKYFSGVWAYPILEVLNMPMRYVMLSALISFTALLYCIGEYLNDIVWGQELKLLKHKQL